jgi:hypothetical protein
MTRKISSAVTRNTSAEAVGKPMAEATAQAGAASCRSCAPLILRVMCVLYGLTYLVMFLTSISCFILQSDASYCWTVQFYYGGLPYPLAVQTGAVYALYMLTGLLVLGGLWRLKKWAWSMFIILTAGELLLVALSMVKAAAANLTMPQPVLGIVDMAFIIYLLIPSIRNRFT